MKTTSKNLLLLLVFICSNCFVAGATAETVVGSGRVVLKKGAIAPYEGMLFDYEHAKKVAEDIAEKKRLQERVALLEERVQIMQQLLGKEKELSELWHKEMIRYQEYWTESQKHVVEATQIAQKIQRDRNSVFARLLPLALPVYGLVKLFK